MTGLEKILAQIRSDADNTCADIKRKTDAQCKAIIAEAEGQAQIILSEGGVNADSAKSNVIARAKSAADLEARTVMLSTKQDIVSSSLEKARKYICELPEDEYFSLIYRMIKKHSEEQTGDICLCIKDLARLPVDFEQKLKTYSKGELILCKEPADIDGGFILRYGGVEVNCAFSSIFSAEAEHFSDEVLTLLFA